VSLRVLEYIEEHRLWENAARMGARLTDALMELQRAQPQVIQDVRGLGLMLGIEYCHEFLGPMMSDALAKHGVFAAYSGNAPQVMRFMVPTTVNAEEMDRIIVAIRDAIADMKRVLPIALLAAKVPPVLKLLNNEHVQIAVFGLLRRIEDLTTKRADAADAPPASAEAALPVAPSEPQPVPEAAEVALPVQKAYAGILGVDLILTRQEGAYVYDQHGERYIDAITAAGTHNLGHRPEELVAELRAAANATDIGNFPMISREKARLGKALSEFVGHGLECAVFSVVRGEAIEAACKIARGFTGRSKLVTVDGGWYGQTGFAMSLSERADKDNYGPLIPDVRVLPFGDADAARAAIGGDTAAVVLELAQAENGCREADAAYARALADVCRQHGAVLIVDETQTGFGRTGAKFLFETLAIEPDMLVLGEALGAGLYPIAVTLLTQRVNTFMNAHPLIHLSTFGGSDIGCRVAKRAVELYAQRAPWANAAAMGEKLLRELNALTHQDGCPIRAVHGRGLLIALDLGSAEQAVAFCRALAKEHLLTLPGEVATHTVVLRPSLLISEEETDAMLAAITAAARQIT
jgi:acetylornithine/succinyldiaminopimelate/putrescine aminotransferase